MGKRTEVHHPKTGKHPKGNHFAAFGYSKGTLREVRGSLVDAVTGDVFEGDILVMDRRWITFFSDVPNDKSNTYTFVLNEVEGGRVLAVVPMVKPTTSDKPEKGKPTIHWPPDGGKVCPSNVVSYGIADNNDPLKGTLSAGGMVKYTGTTVLSPQLPGSPAWCVQFSGVANGTYTLTIIQTPPGGTSNTSAETILVDPSECP
jgi:hypothetical protein